jgi:uncharacterized protein (UPF0303 family)
MTMTDDLAAIAHQELQLIFEKFDEASAWSLGSRLREMAVARGYPLVIDVRRFGQQLFCCALAGAVPDQAEWVRRKVNVVARFHRSSYAVGRELARGNSSLEERYGLPTIDYAAHGGCFPIRVAGAGVIGCVTVSGLPQRTDHELVVEAICLELGKNFEEFRLAAAPTP